MTATRREAGFTLIELLVGLTLFALLMALVPGTIKLSKRAWDTATRSSETTTASTLNFAVQHLADALPVFVRSENGLQTLAFSGTRDHLSYVANLAHGPEGGGLYAIEAGVLPEPQTRSKTWVRITPFRENQAAPASGSTIRELDETFSAISFRYFGQWKAGEAQAWTGNWPRRDRLPDLVEVIAVRGEKTGLRANLQRVELRLRRMP